MISAIRIREILKDSLFTPDELDENGEPRVEAVKVDGIRMKVGFHPTRLESHREEVRQMLLELPKPFMAGEGGEGWALQNACQTKDGIQWTEILGPIEELVMLGIGLKLARYCAPRDMWSHLPGGLPYFVVEADPVKTRLTVN